MIADRAITSELSRRELWAAIARLGGVLRDYLAARNGVATEPSEAPLADESAPLPSTLTALTATFDLSDFERDVIVICAGVELDDELARLVAEVAGDPRRGFTFAMALDVLPGANWRALTPSGPLRRFGLVELSTGHRVMRAPLAIDERVLHYLAGASCFDERLVGLVEVMAAVEPEDMPASHRALLPKLTGAWSSPTSPHAIVQLCGREYASMAALAAAAAGQLGIQVLRLRATDVPTAAAERERMVRLCEREAGLTVSALYIDFDDRDDAETQRAVASFVEVVRAPVFVGCREPLRVPRRAVVQVDVAPPGPSEQLQLWRDMLGEIGDELAGELPGVASQFSFGLGAIRSASHNVRGAHGDLGTALWNACRAEARPKLDELAQRIEPMATWHDLVLPEQQLAVLRELSLHGRHRSTVYETWGFGARTVRGNGTSALFSGVSGTGKTMAAEVLALELGLDLYRIDLSQVVSKYIGETEKNLRRVFDAAETGGVLLLFDEADALFGKRSEVKDSHDRYANIEVSYLLQRMEQYRGLALLTTNMKESLDPAFLRRIRFVVQFPFPDLPHRAEIWRRVFPTAAPTIGLDHEQLARLHVTGGNIRNIALNGAFLAASAKEPVMMKHLLQAARTECMKLGRHPAADEVGGWT
ncbi:MAG: AAA family ATPase [Deltaproteobacteria bacterium]